MGSPARTCRHAHVTTLTRRRAAAANLQLGRRELRAAAVLFVLVAGGHALGSMVVYQFDHTPSSGVSFFPAEGVTLAAFLLGPTRRWPVVALATFAAEDLSHFVLHESALTGVGLALSNTIGPMIGAWVVLRVLGHVPALENPRDLWVLIGGGVLLGPLFDALTGPPFARLTLQASPYLETTARWWTGDALGGLIVALLILAWAQPVRWPRPDGTLVGEAAACAVVLAAVAYATFLVFADPLAYLVLLPVGWAALRFGMRGATAAVAGVTVIAEWASVTGHGPFVAGSPVEVRSALWLLQMFLAVSAIAAVAVASEVAQTRRAEAARRASELAEHRAELAVEQAATVERGRLARELHDSVSQALFATALHARSAEKQLTRQGIAEPKLAADIGALRELTAAALAEMRALISSCGPKHSPPKDWSPPSNATGLRSRPAPSSRLPSPARSTGCH